MKFGLSFPIHDQFADPHLHLELATLAEQSGWDGYFVWDHIAWKTKGEQMPVSDPWVILSAVAVQTERVKLGPMVVPLVRRRPWKVARESVALDHLSNGRLILGVGLGAFVDTEWKPFGEMADTRKRGRMLDEALDILTGLWSGEPFGYDGAFYQVKETQFRPKPKQTPRIPIWAAGSLKKAGKRKPLRRAARFDGSFPLAPKQAATPEAYADLKAFIQSQRTSNEPFDIVCERSMTKKGIGSAEIVQPYADAGVTWWLVNSSGRPVDLDQIRRLIQQGPPS